MAITTTLLIRSHTYSGVTADSSLTLTVVVLGELYLGTITLIKGEPAEATTGTVNKGAPKRPGFAEGRISAELWDKILADLGTFTLTLQLRYRMTSATTGTFNETFIGVV